jgi:hypothetical protein
VFGLRDVCIQIRHRLQFASIGAVIRAVQEIEEASRRPYVLANQGFDSRAQGLLEVE